MISVFWILLLLLLLFYVILHVLIWYCVRYRGFFDEFEDGAPITPPVSILINSKDEENHIFHCLKSISEQDYPKENIEVIVIDESTDNTPKIVQDFANNINNGMVVKLIQPSEPAPPNVNNLVHCLNIGIRNAKHDIIAYTEADCTPRKKWLRSLMYPLADPRIGFTGTHGVISGKNLSPTLQRLEYSGLLFEYNAGIDNIRRYLKMGGIAWAGSLGYKRSVFDAVEGYKGIEHIHIHEVALCAKFARAGYESRFIFSQDAKVDTAPHPSPIKQRLRWFRGTWQCREYKFHVATFGTYLLPLILETASFITLILYFLIEISQEDFNAAILTIFTVFIIKYVTLFQFTRSHMLLKGSPLSVKAVIFYYFWLYLVQWLYFFSIFTRPKTSWREEEPPKNEIASINH
ncbi:MAG: glycosyltransferase [Candidatus Helarchaeota archaeon]